MRKEEKQKAKEERKDIPEYQRIAMRDKKAFLSEKCKKKKEK